MLCFNEADAKSTVAAFRDNVEQMVICSSIAAYKRPYKSVPTIESAEHLFDDPVFSYAFEKAEMERFLHRVIQDKNLPITITRPSLTFGPGAVNIGVLRQNYGIIDRIRKDKPLVMFGDGSTSFSFTFVPDLAKGFAGVLGKKETYAGIFDNSKFRSVMPQFKAGLSLNAGLRIIVDWWEKEANIIDPEKEALEDKLVSMYSSWADQIKNLYTQ